MDVWVCHAPDLSDNELVELRKKCQLLEAWAQSMGAEAHFFLIEPSPVCLGRTRHATELRRLRHHPALSVAG
ncbi:MAG: hypothetical protein LKM38_18595 [Pseudomonas veronii]|jgi:adenylate cyclase class 1|nr:hypothetical protein [Pseudomonas veronii]